MVGESNETDFSSRPDPQSGTRSDEATDAKKWRPLTSHQRRVLGVLVEKAKTTPNAYPMTLNAITSGCNQTSNRDPVMSLNADTVETVLDELREIGVVAEVHGSGRVPKFRHYAYEWMGVDKYEIAVMTELLLRGEQTLGDLRARASRMERFDSLNTLKEVVDKLMERGLMLAVTPPGRGQIVTHALFTEREKERMKFADPSDWQDMPQESSAASSSPCTSISSTANSSTSPASSSESTEIESGATTARFAESSSQTSHATQSKIESLEAEIEQLKDQLETANDQIRELTSRIETIESLIQ